MTQLILDPQLIQTMLWKFLLLMFATFALWAMLRLWNKLSGDPFHELFTKISGDPLSSSVYLGLRFFSIAFIVAAVLA